MLGVVLKGASVILHSEICVLHLMQSVLSALNIYRQIRFNVLDLSSNILGSPFPFGILTDVRNISS